MSEPVGNTPRSAIPGNTHKQREAAQPELDTREKAEKIIEGKVVVRKPNVFKRLARSMVAEDVGNVGDFVVTDVLGPALRNLVYDIIVKGAGRTIFGAGSMRGVTTARDPRTPGASLKTAYHRVTEEPARTMSREGAARHQFDELKLDERVEAINVLEALVDRCARYGSATVGDLYDFLGVTGSAMDRVWGWTDLSAADIRQHRDGYTFDLPRPVKLNS